MPLDVLVQTLSKIYENRDAQDVFGHALTGFSNMALVSSFGVESVVLMHLAVQIDRKVPMPFIATQILLAETPHYQRDVAAKIGLTNMQVICAPCDILLEHDKENLLHLHDPYVCCALRKAKPLQKILLAFNGWILGRKQYQGGGRLTSNLLGVDPPLDRMPRIKVNPPAQSDSSNLITAHNLLCH